MTIIESLIKERLDQVRSEYAGIEERYVKIGEERGEERGEKHGEKRGIERGELVGSIRHYYEFAERPLADAQLARLRRMAVTYLDDLYAQVRKGVFPEI